MPSASKVCARCSKSPLTSPEMEPLKIGIIAFLALVALLAVVWLLFPIFKTMYIKKHLVPYFGKRIYHIALYNDFYLINEVNLKLDEDSEAHIDHLLFGEKYIYVIKDRYYDGAIDGQEKDSNWSLMLCRARQRCSTSCL